jgi:hypothetical protein
VQLPAPGQGLWPAFWLLPSVNTYGDWPASGEVSAPPVPLIYATASVLPVCAVTLYNTVLAWHVSTVAAPASHVCLLSLRGGGDNTAGSVPFCAGLTPLPCACHMQIDILESINNMLAVTQTLHFGGARELGSAARPVLAQHRGRDCRRAVSVPLFLQLHSAPTTQTDTCVTAASHHSS